VLGNNAFFDLSSLISKFVPAPRLILVCASATRITKLLRLGRHDGILDYGLAVKGATLMVADGDYCRSWYFRVFCQGFTSNMGLL
jgi:hypothetical protein